MEIISFIFLASLLVAGVIFAWCIFYAIIGGIGQILSDISKAFKDHFSKRNEIKKDYNENHKTNN